MSVLSWIVIYLIVGVLIYLIIYLMYPKSLPLYSSNIVKTTKNSLKGNILVDLSGASLYIFDKDSKGVSNCIDNCAAIWPPFSANLAPSNLPTNITVIQRPDGSMQYAWMGMPLYYYASDKKVGDINGDGVGGVWHLVKP